MEESTNIFRLKHFSLHNEKSALKIGTDSILLGSIASIPEKCTKIIDVGTGTGIVAMMLAQRCSSAQITGIEIDKPSWEEAAENFAASPWSERLAAHCCDFLKAELCVDQNTLVISNPPYYEEDTLSPFEEKARAKNAGEGLGYRDIFDKFASVEQANKPQITLILPYCAKDAAFFHARSRGFFPCRCVNVKTLENKPFKRIVVEFCGDRNAVLKEENLTLFTHGSAKTQQYTEITKDFQ